jgi:hypothetical protein
MDQFGIGSVRYIAGLETAFASCSLRDHENKEEDISMRKLMRKLLLRRATRGGHAHG